MTGSSSRTPLARLLNPLLAMEFCESSMRNNPSFVQLDPCQRELMNSSPSDVEVVVLVHAESTDNADVEA